MCWQCCLCLSIFSYKIEYFYEELQAFVCGSFLDGKITGKPFQATYAGSDLCRMESTDTL